MFLSGQERRTRHGKTPHKIMTMLELIGQSSTETNVIAHLRTTSLLRTLNNQELTEIASRAHIIPLEKGRILYLTGDSATSAFIVRSGWVRLYRETLDGVQATIDIVGTDSLFGETALFYHGAYDCTAEVVESGHAISLPLAALSSLLDSSPSFARRMLTEMTRVRQMRDHELEHRDLQTAPQRIGCFLLRLLPAHQKTGRATLQLPYDKTLIAARLGMQPETFSRALARLRDETGVQIKGGTVECEDITTLSSYACGACSACFPCKDLRAQA